MVDICCPIHGVFTQRWSNHIAGSGCSVCGNVSKQTKLKKSNHHFIQLCVQQHGQLYDYRNLQSSVTRHSMVSIICPVHGEFKQLLNSHINGSGCKRCADVSNAMHHQKGRTHYVTEATKIHNDIYDYSGWSDNIKTTDVVSIICPTHGEFKQLLNSHLSGRGCNKCKVSKYADTVFSKYGVSHILQRDISASALTHLDDPAWLVNQHVQLQKPLSEIANCLSVSPSVVGHRMNKHNIGIHHYFRSVAERDIATSLTLLCPDLEIVYNNRTLVGCELDLYLPKYKIAIEHNGLYWHSEKHKPSRYHLDKTIACDNKGIRLIHIFEDEWRDSKQKCIDTIMHLIGKSKQGVYARHTTIREIPWIEAKVFLDKYHLLNAGHAGNYRIGAYDQSDELIGVMVFGHQNNERSNAGSVELRRFVTNKHNNPGLGSKLFKYATRTQKYTEVIAFVDRRWFTGLVKSHIGFERVGTTDPAVWWTNGTKRYHRRFKTKQQLLTMLPNLVNPTKQRMLDDLGFYRIYDSGKVKLKWTPTKGSDT